ncbi:hypothetical protein NDU88_008390 [Pleurodeles waltl]|uniref:Uncharacterized protein n=1 Tax=Pleurodeles waltl TaxID=8319 RepID=A0AAV7QND4_PLEWA|nr:hypothetical protein NDU88_008390 [Pleurodeles waltl]
MRNSRPGGFPRNALGVGPDRSGLPALPPVQSLWGPYLWHRAASGAYPRTFTGGPVLLSSSGTAEDRRAFAESPPCCPPGPRLRCSLLRITPGPGSGLLCCESSVGTPRPVHSLLAPRPSPGHALMSSLGPAAQPRSPRRGRSELACSAGVTLTPSDRPYVASSSTPAHSGARSRPPLLQEQRYFSTPSPHSACASSQPRRSCHVRNRSRGSQAHGIIRVIAAT